MFQIQPTSIFKNFLEKADRIRFDPLRDQAARVRRAKTNFIMQAVPYHRALCELEMTMPMAFLQKSDGTMTKIEHHNWPPWAIQRKKLLTEILADIQKRCFEAEGFCLPLPGRDEPKIISENP